MVREAPVVPPLAALMVPVVATAVVATPTVAMDAPHELLAVEVR